MSLLNDLKHSQSKKKFQLSPKQSLQTQNFRKVLYIYKRDRERLDLEIKLNGICESYFMSNKELDKLVRDISIDKPQRKLSSSSSARSTDSKKFRIKTEQTATSRNTPSSSLYFKQDQMKLRKTYFDFTITPYFA